MVDIKKIKGRSNSEAISWIDKEEDRIIRHILALRAIRNSVAPAINRLPDEIISNIMILFKNFHLQKGYSFERSWERITFVCRWWRSVALKTAVLWTNIDFDHGSGAAAYLSRSQNAHLYVNTNFSLSPTAGVLQQFVEMLIPHSTRVVVLVASVRLEQLEYLASFLSSPLPKLRFLSVNISSYSLDSPRILLNVPTPHSLRTVCLDGVSISHDSHILRGLQRLHLHGQILHDAFPSPEAFLELLEHNPRLTQLSISEPRFRQLPPDVIHMPWPQRQVAAKFLRSLTLKIERKQTLEFLSHVRIPKSAKIAITYRLFDTFGDVDQDFSTVLPWRRDNRLECLSSVDRVFLRCLSHSDIHIEAFEGERTCFKVSFDGASFFNGPGLDHIALSFYATIGKVFQFSPVTSLSMEFDDPAPTVDEWLFLLSNFPTLKHFDITYVVWDSFEPTGQALWEALGDSREDESFICPRLLTLKVTGLMPNDVSNESLVSCLRRRIQNGLPKLTQLQLSRIFGEEGEGVGWPSIEEYVSNFLHN